MTRLSDLSILVTGAARGMGAVTAKRLLAEGARVAFADINTAGVAEAEPFGDRAMFVELDVTDESSWQAAVAEVDASFGAINGLVNNAGVLWMGRLTEMPVEDARRVLDVNVLGTFLGIKTVAPVMARTGGSIVNISSIDGVTALNSVALYTGSKWAVRGITRAAALELGTDGIRVNAVCPAIGSEEMIAPFLAEMDLARYIEGAPKANLLDGETPRSVTMSDVAAMVSFLMSDDSATCSGADFVVDAAETAGSNRPGLPGF